MLDHTVDEPAYQPPNMSAVFPRQPKPSQIKKEMEMSAPSDNSEHKPNTLNLNPSDDTPRNLPQKEKFMTVRQRFVVEVECQLSNDVDLHNPNGPKGWIWEGAAKDQVSLREVVFRARLRNSVADLINSQEANSRERNQQFSEEIDAINRAICAALCASPLNTVDPAVSIQNRFNGNLKRQKSGLQAFTSLSLFRDDVERILRDLFGDIESEALEKLLDAVLTIAEEFTHYVRKDIWQEHHDAKRRDYIVGIGPAEEYGIYGISRCDYWNAIEAEERLRLRGDEVLKNPCAFSRYTVEFVKYCDEQFTWFDERKSDRTRVEEIGDVPF